MTRDFFTWDSAATGEGLYLFEPSKYLKDVVEGLTRYLLEKHPGTVVYLDLCPFRSDHNSSKP